MHKAPWGQRAREALRDLAASGASFTADDLIARVGHPDKSHAPNARNNSIGSLFREASTSNLIVAVGVQKSTQPERKGGMVRIWRGA